MNSKFIIGLGNIGNEYTDTRHNAGFAILNALKNHYESQEQIHTVSVKKLKSQIFSIPSKKIYLVYPQTYMNLSGFAVRALIDWYKISNLKNLVIVHDDIALPLGQIRWVAKGGAGGQHGIESIIEHLGGNKEFNRLKFGIGPDPGGEKRSKYVLGKFRDDEKEILNKSLNKALKSLNLFLQGSSMSDLMNEFNVSACS